MCEPVSISLLAASAAGAQAYSVYQQGEAEAAALGQQARLERTRALDATERGAVEAARATSAGTAAVAENKAGLASGGVDVQAGSSLDVLAGTREAFEAEAVTIRNNARREAWGHKVSADQLDFQRKLTKRNARIGAGATFLGGLAQAGAGYYSMKKG